MATVKDYPKSRAWKSRFALFAVSPLLKKEAQREGTNCPLT
jgi:hypothetical protein